MDELEQVKRLRRKLAVFGLLSVAMMAFIFAFSAMNGKISSSESDGIAYWIAWRFIDGFSAMNEAEKSAAVHAMTYPIRKTAHVTEYAVLGGLLAATFWQAVQLRAIRHEGEPRLWRAWASGFAIAVLYACTDEFHQTFVAGRTGQPTDVLIDSIGILAGTLLALWIAEGRRDRGL